MGFFNFIETFFFISLAITFVLILLLVYHFKQRIATLEHKGDTMFEIINNIVKEMSAIKNAVITQMRPPPQTYMPSQTYTNSFVQMPIFNTPSESVHGIPECNFDEVEQDDTSSDSNDDDDSDSDDDDDSDSDDDNNKKIVVSDNEDSDDETNDVKIITLDLELEELVDPVLNETVIDELDINELLESGRDSDPSTDESIVVVPSEKDAIQVSKLEETNYSATIDTKPNKNGDIYQKMSTSALKALVISQGLHTNPSKMKKPELIQLLETQTKTD